MMLKAECMANEVSFAVPKLDLSQAKTSEIIETVQPTIRNQSVEGIITDRQDEKNYRSCIKTEKRLHKKNMSSNPEIVFVNQFSSEVNDFNNMCENEQDDDESQSNAFNQLIEKTEKKIRQQSIVEDDVSTNLKVPLTIFEGDKIDTQKIQEEVSNSSDECMQEIVSPFRGISRLNDGAYASGH